MYVERPPARLEGVGFFLFVCVASGEGGGKREDIGGGM